MESSIPQPSLPQYNPAVSTAVQQYAPAPLPVAGRELYSLLLPLSH